MMQKASVETLLIQGNEQLERGQYQAALDTFQQADRPFRRNLQVKYKLGLACYGLERYQQSVKYCNEALKIKPKYILALVHRGLAYLQLNQTQQARRDLEQAIQIEPQDYEDWRGKGIALCKFTRNEEAIASYDRAIVINPEYHEAWHDRGFALYSLGRYEEAVASYDKALEIKPDYYHAWDNRGNALNNLGQCEEAVASFDKALEIKPDYDDAWNSRGVALCNLGRLADAIASYDRAIEFKSDYHYAWNNRGVSLDHLQRYQEAIASYDRAIEIKSDFHQAWNNRGLTLNKLGRYEEALASSDRAIQIKSDYYEAWYSRGFALAHLQRYEEALASSDRALQFQPYEYEAWENRGLALKKLGRYEEAIASYDRAIQIKSDLHEAWCSRANALDSLARYEEAIASYERAIQIKPDFHEAWNNRANALYSLGRYEESLASCERAIEIKPDFHEAWNDRGVVLYENLQRYEEAIASYDRALEFKSDYHEAWYNRGLVLKHLKRYEEAIASYDRALEFQPDYHEALLNRKVALSAKLKNYEEAIASYEQAIKFTSDSHGAWDNWNLSARKQQNPFPDWLNAQKNCLEALDELAFEQSPLQHLEVLQYLLKICDYLGDTKIIEERLEKGRQQLDELQQKCQFEGEKISLERKFAAFEQLRIDRLADSPNPDKQIQALELAEKRKNDCWGWLHQGWGYNEPSPKYSEMQQLLNSNTAIIYWHVSPVGITTWILKHNQPPQILQRKRNISKQQPQQYPADAYQLHQFEEWLEAWKSDYQTYRNSRESATEKSQLRWRALMRSRLTKLGKILDIPRIQNCLRDVAKLILIPHRDLHLLPLHCLFSPRFTITYLPSAKIGLSLPKPQPVASILNVENTRPDLAFATIQSIVISSLYPHYQDQNLKVRATTKSELIEKLRTNSGNFHFTGHGYHDIDEPQKSALLLADTDKLTLEDIFSDSNNLYFNKYSLICLSACESGITSEQNLIDEYVGLTTGFLAKGASCVVSTLWKVDEESTALLMIKFYQLINSGESPAAALKYAQDWLRHLTYCALADWYTTLANELTKSKPSCSEYLGTIAIIIKRNSDTIASKKPFEDPYYWAAFILTGKAPEK